MVRKITVLSIAIVLAAIGFGCGSPSPSDQNNATPLNTTGNPSPTPKPSETPIPIHQACTDNPNDLAERARQVESKIIPIIDADPELAGKVQVRAIVPGNNKYIELYVTGKALGERELEDLSKIIRQFMTIQCVLVVKFVSVLPAVTAPVADPPLEWTACQHPERPCPQGHCSSNGECIPFVPPGNGNTNTNANTNTNTNSKTNTAR